MSERTAPRGHPLVHPSRRQAGAALLMAMVCVSLVATLAAGAFWLQWRAVEIEQTERARVQAAWLLTGMLDFARHVLREDGRTSPNQDHLGEPWAIPLEEARLSAFLAAGSRESVDTDTALAAFASGRIEDAQSRLNVYNLIQNNKVSAEDLARLERLFLALQLPATLAQSLAGKLETAVLANASPSSAPAAAMPLPHVLDDLGRFGLDARTRRTLRPHLGVLMHRRTPINLNTASAQVLHAHLATLTLSDAQNLVSARDRNPFRSSADAERILNLPSGQLSEGTSVSSSFFEVQTRVRLDGLVRAEWALVERTSNGTVLRERRGLPLEDVGP